MSDQVKEQESPSGVPQFKLRQMSHEYIESCLRLIVRNFYDHHFIFKMLRPDPEDLISHYSPIIADENAWKYSYIITDENTNEVIAMTFQKDAYDETPINQRELHESDTIQFKQKLYWNIMDSGLMEKSEDCKHFKIDQSSKQVLGNIAPNVFMFHILNLIDADYIKYRIGSMLQIVCEQKAIDAGFVYGVAACSNDKMKAICIKFGNDISNKTDLTRMKFQGQNIFGKYKTNKYMYTVTTCYKNPKKRQIINQILKAQPKL